MSPPCFPLWVLLANLLPSPAGAHSCQPSCCFHCGFWLSTFFHFNWGWPLSTFHCFRWALRCQPSSVAAVTARCRPASVFRWGCSLSAFDLFCRSSALSTFLRFNWCLVVVSLHLCSVGSLGVELPVVLAAGAPHGTARSTPLLVELSKQRLGLFRIHAGIPPDLVRMHVQHFFERFSRHLVNWTGLAGAAPSAVAAVVACACTPPSP